MTENDLKSISGEPAGTKRTKRTNGDGDQRHGLALISTNSKRFVPPPTIPVDSYAGVPVGNFVNSTNASLDRLAFGHN